MFFSRYHSGKTSKVAGMAKKDWIRGNMGIFHFLPRCISTWTAILVLLPGSVVYADYTSSIACWSFTGPANTSESGAWDFGEKDSSSRSVATKWVNTEDNSQWIVGNIPENATTGLFSFSTAFSATQLRQATGDAKIEFFFSIRFNMDPLCKPTDIWIDDIKGGFHNPNIVGENLLYSCSFLVEDGVNFDGDHTIEFVFDLAELNAGLSGQETPPSSLALYIEFGEIAVREHNVDPYATPEPGGMLLLGCACVFLPFRRRLRSLLP